MVYELTLQAVKIKLNLFDPPAKIINAKEFSCVLGMVYRQAGMPMPNLTNGMSIIEFKDMADKEAKILDNKIKLMLDGYSVNESDIIDEDVINTFKLGYSVVE